MIWDSVRWEEMQLQRRSSHRSPGIPPTAGLDLREWLQIHPFEIPHWIHRIEEHEPPSTSKKDQMVEWREPRLILGTSRTER